MNFKLPSVLVLLVFTIAVFSQNSGLEMTLRADKQYLLYPVNMNTPRKRLEFKAKNFETYFDIRISSDPDSTDFWTFMDIKRFAGQKLTISSSEATDAMKNAFHLIAQDDEIYTNTPIYSEKLRQQVHFSSRRGWNNDPNGLVFFEGEYHLFYQHNPYGWYWGNMHWGHAESKDLIHWEELPDALYPDELGTMFSGSAVIDRNNTAGYGENTLVAFYTADRSSPRHEVQCMAYSNDKGRTFTKYEGNPVINSFDRWESHSTRDPKVFWYEPDNKWVMALYEVNGISIYNSDNLKEWTYMSHEPDFYECPELFELAVDGDNSNKKWVMYGASGAYKIGSFNGEEFKTEISRPSYVGGGLYAAQTYNNTPDGRRIQIGWGRIPSEGMPFNQMMTFPSEFKLKNTAEGLRLQLKPIEEISLLYRNSYHYENIPLKQENIKDAIKQPSSRLLHIKANILLNGNLPLSAVINGHRITFNPRAEKKNETFMFVPRAELKLEFITDINSIEVYMDNGQFVKVIHHNATEHEPEFSFEGNGDGVIQGLEIHELKSLWNK